MIKAGYETKKSVLTSLFSIGAWERSPVNFFTDRVQRTQDLSPIMVSKGAFFIAKACDILDQKKRLPEPLLFYPLDHTQSIEIDNFDYNLNVLADTFADYFDDLWVKQNLDNISSETKVLAEVSYQKYNEWIKIKNFLINNEKILKYKILVLSNKTALIELNILSIDNLVQDLKRNKFKIVKKKNNLFISKDES